MQIYEFMSWFQNVKFMLHSNYPNVSIELEETYIVNTNSTPTLTAFSPSAFPFSGMGTPSHEGLSPSFFKYSQFQAHC